jgi:hypothetical protein
VRWVVLGERRPLIRQRTGVVLRYWEECFLDEPTYQRIQVPGRLPAANPVGNLPVIS